MLRTVSVGRDVFRTEIEATEVREAEADRSRYIATDAGDSRVVIPNGHGVERADVHVRVTEERGEQFHLRGLHAEHAVEIQHGGRGRGFDRERASTVTALGQ